MTKKGSKLEFISRIKRDGSGTSPVTDDYIEFLKDDVFKVECLSISHDTWIAIGFNSFVVRIKD